MRQRILLILALIMTSMSTWSADRETCAFWIGDFGYSFNSDKESVKLANCNKSGDIIVPDSVKYEGKTYAVITIATACFDGSKATSITIPKTVRWLDNNCFDNASNLKKVIFEDGTDRVHCGYSKGWTDDELFYNCNSLKDVYLGRDLEYNDGDEDRPLQGVSSLDSLTVGPTVTFIMGSFCKGSGLRKLNLSKATNLKDIWEEAFNDCTNLADIQFDGCTSLENIHEDAFADCDKLDSVVLKNCTKLTTLCKEAFFDCDALNTVKFPSSLTSIGVDAFDRWAGYYSKVRNVYFYGDKNSASVACWNGDKANFSEATYVYLDRIINTDDDDPAFESCQKLTIGSNVTAIATHCFEDSEIAGLLIPTNVNTIGYKAFYDCDDLCFVQIADTTAAISFGANDDGETKAFDSCSKLVLAKLGRNIVYDTSKMSQNDWLTSSLTNNMELSPFWDGYLQNVIIGDSVDTLLPFLFEDCNRMTSVLIGSGVKTIGEGVFKDCGKLAAVTLKDGKDPITIKPYAHFGEYTGKCAFEDCTLTAFDMGRDIVDTRNSNKRLFNDDTAEKLEAVTIGEYVTKIPENMFHHCRAITDLTLHSNQVTVNTKAFQGCWGLKNLTFDGNANIVANAFDDCSALESVSFQGAPAFGENAFSGCKAIKSVIVRYDANPTTDVGQNTTFAEDVYSKATLYNLGDDNSFQVDFSKCIPWSLFGNRDIYAGTVTMKYTADGDNLAAKDVASLSMEYGFNEKEATLVSLPFKVDSYYFGSDATIYTLKADYGTYDDDNNTWSTEKLDLDAIETLPVNTLLLVVVPRGETLVKAPINMFVESALSATPESYVSSNGPMPIGFAAGITAAQNEITSSDTGDNDVYVVNDGIMKRVNTETYSELPAFDGVIYDSEKKEFHLLDATTQKKIVNDGFDVTPSKYLEGYTTFYNDTTDCEITTVTANGTETIPEIYVITETNGTELKLQLIDDGIVNKGQAVIIKAVAGQRMFVRAVTSPSSSKYYSNNLLKGVDTDTPVADLLTEGYDYIYVLSSNSTSNGEVGLYRYGSGKTLGAHKAYLDPSHITVVGAKMLSFTFDGTTSLDKVETVSNADGSIYDVSGRKVNTMRKNDIYIIDNKKIINK